MEKHSNDQELLEEPLKHQLIRLLIQSIDGLGYGLVAKELEQQSGVCAMDTVVGEFCNSVCMGDWQLAEKFVWKLGMEDMEALHKVRFLLFEQKYLETLESGHVESALVCLRTEVTPLCTDMKRLQRLTALIMCKTAEDLRRQSHWNGKGLESRKQLLREIQRHIPPSILLPEKRLEQLIIHALESQKRQAIYPYCKPSVPSLLEDLEYCPSKIPHLCYATLKGHSDEVWFVAFSNSGKYLASLSKDRVVLVWDLEALKLYDDDQLALVAKETYCSEERNGEAREMPVHGNGAVHDEINNVNNQENMTVGSMQHFGYLGEHRVVSSFVGHHDDVTFLAWSPNDQYLATCSNDHCVLIWDMASGECHLTLSDHKESVSSCAWLSNGQRLITGGPDEHIYEYDLFCTQPTTPLCSYKSKKVADLVVTPDDEKIIAVSEKSIQIFDRSTQEEITCLQETSSITSTSLSKDGRYLLTNIAAKSATSHSEGKAEIHLWDLQHQKMIQEFYGQRQVNFVIRSAFGGQNEVFVISGSEDSSVYMWLRESGELIYRLDGHVATVSCVDWSPTDPFLFASASDDHTIRLWSNSEQIQARHQQQ
eukprot:jgi/Galph1/3500/GphlegSOOS_G2179.1